MLLALQEEHRNKSPSEIGQLLDAQAIEIAHTVENQIEKRLEKLEIQIERITESIIAQNETLVSLGASTDCSPQSAAAQQEQQRELEQKLDQVTERFSEKTDTIAGLFKSQIEQMFEDLVSKVSASSNGSVSQQENVVETPVLTTTSDDSDSHWQKQKEAMLSKYGIDPDYRPVIELPESPEPVKSEKEIPSVNSVDSTASMSEADAVAIEELKERLNAKLQDAEVELSIGRAKISQQQAELADDQVELDRRAKAIEEKYAAVAQAPKRRVGFFVWLWIHLKPKKPAVNDRA